MDFRDYTTPGTLTTLRYRTKLLMRMYSVGCSPWVVRALKGQLPTMVVGGTKIR